MPSALLLAEQEVYGYTFTEGRYDIGKKLDYLRATVELRSSARTSAPSSVQVLAEIVRRHGIC